MLINPSQLSSNNFHFQPMSQLLFHLLFTFQISIVIVKITIAYNILLIQRVVIKKNLIQVTFNLDFEPHLGIRYLYGRGDVNRNEYMSPIRFRFNRYGYKKTG